MKSASLILLTLIFFSCNAVKVNYDYDKETDFSAYNTYNFYPDMETGLSDLDNKRLFNVLDIALQSRGLVFSEEPDFYINVESKAYQSAQNNNVGIGVGGGGGNIGGGVSVGIPIGQPSLQRHIQFDFVDARKDVLFWQAVSESSYKENAPPEAREEKLRILVEKVLSKYPPKSKKQ